MKLNAQRKAYAVVLGLAVLALGADRFLLGGGAMSPRSASAQDGGAPGAGTPAPATPAGGASASAGVPARERTLAARLEGLRASSKLERASAGLFSTGSDWLAPARKEPAEETRAAEVEPLKDVLGRHRVTGVMKAGSEWVVFIDGETRRVGYEFSGVRVAEIRARFVRFVRGAESMELTRFDAHADGEADK